VLDFLTDDYSVFATPGGLFTVAVRLSGRVGPATGEPEAGAISLSDRSRNSLGRRAGDGPILC
jgi:hypothetical protein